MLVVVRLAGRSTVVNEYATQAPSELICGSATRLKRNRSSMIMGRLSAAHTSGASKISIKKEKKETARRFISNPFDNSAFKGATGDAAYCRKGATQPLLGG